MVSAMVNNTSVALYEAAVDATTVYPVGGAATGGHTAVAAVPPA